MCHELVAAVIFISGCRMHHSVRHVLTETHESREEGPNRALSLPTSRRLYTCSEIKRYITRTLDAGVPQGDYGTLLTGKIATSVPHATLVQLRKAQHCTNINGPCWSEPTSSRMLQKVVARASFIHQIYAALSVNRIRVKLTLPLERLQLGEITRRRM